MKAKLLFLDIDGVLNHDNTPKATAETPFVPPQHVGYIWLDSERIQKVNRILDAAPDTVIVLSSTWREYGLSAVEDALRANGFKYRLSDATPFFKGLSFQRADEIMRWFKKNNLKPSEHNFVVLDDIFVEFVDELEGHQVRTSDCPIDGFTEQHIQKAIKLLLGIENGSD